MGCRPGGAAAAGAACDASALAVNASHTLDVATI